MEENTQNLTKKERRELKRQEKTSELDKDKQKKLIRSILGWVVALGLIGTAVYALVSYDGNLTERVDAIGEVREGDWTRGNPDAPVILIEYSDFQCPACGAYEPMIQQIIGEFPEDLLFVYRHFPLTTIHPNAEEAGWASEAAGRQGKFWEMHDLLFTAQTDWAGLRDPKDTFIEYAQQLELNVEQFENDYESGEVRGVVSDQLSESRTAGFSGTPTFIINGERLLSNPQSLDEFRNLIRQNI